MPNNRATIVAINTHLHRADHRRIVRLSTRDACNVRAMLQKTTFACSPSFRERDPHNKSHIMQRNKCPVVAFRSVARVMELPIVE